MIERRLGQKVKSLPKNEAKTSAALAILGLLPALSHKYYSEGADEEKKGGKISPTETLCPYSSGGSAADTDRNFSVSVGSAM